MAYGMALRAASTAGASGFTKTKTIKLPSGHAMPSIGFGTFGLKPEKTAGPVKHALDIGYRLVDTAVIYQNEAQVGEAVNTWIQEGKGKRDDVFVTTKIWHDQKARDAVVPAIQQSLDASQLGYYDLVLIHWPVTDQPGSPMKPTPQETWEGLEEAVDKGLVKSIGISNHSPDKANAWYSKTRHPVSVNQVEIHPQFRNEKVVQWGADSNVHIQAYSPLTTPGQMESMGKNVPNLMQDERVKEIASKLGKTPAQVLLAWGLQRGTSVIPKAEDLTHQEEDLEAFGFELPEEDFKYLSQLSPQIRYLKGAGMAYSEKGPWHSYEEFWDEPEPQEEL